jgi:hypothetical protein
MLIGAMHNLGLFPNRPQMAGGVVTNPYALDNASWNSVTQLTRNANVTNAPDGTATADSLIPTAVSSNHAVLQSTLTVTAAGWTARGRFKYAGYRYAAFAIPSSPSYATNIILQVDLLTGRMVSFSAAGSYTLANCRPLVKKMANGWVLAQATIDTAVANSTHRYDIYVDATPGVGGTYTVDGVSGVYAWGCELAPTPT